MAKYDHEHHKYERMVTGKKGNVIFKCMLEDCSHFLPTPELIINRVSLCWGVCGSTTVYTKEDFIQGLKHPMCASCRDLRQKQKDALSRIA